MIKKVLIACFIVLTANVFLVCNVKADAWLIIPAGYYDRSQWTPTRIYHYAEFDWMPYDAATRCRMDLIDTPITALCTIHQETAWMFWRY